MSFILALEKLGNIVKIPQVVKILAVATTLIETDIQVFHHIAGKAAATRVVVDKLPKMLEAMLHLTMASHTTSMVTITLCRILNISCLYLDNVTRLGLV